MKTEIKSVVRTKTGGGISVLIFHPGVPRGGPADNRFSQEEKINQEILKGSVIQIENEREKKGWGANSEKKEKECPCGRTL